MGWSGAGDIRFDWEGSLRIARRLWALADQLDSTMTNRVTAAEDALVDWLGAYGIDFAGRISTEAGSAAGISSGLREGANAWAFQWKSAMDEQNRRLHAREENRVRDSRSNMDKIGGFFTGHDDLPPRPNEATTPSAPGFWATRSFVRY